ncbi:MAG: FAD-binding and (Fe-S)-binding domain-containing protein, partial [Planctomycetaceae bacterium]
MAATVRWAADQGIAVHARGGGSSVCGGSLGGGVVIDCARFMRRIVATTGDTVRVQPGVTAAELEGHLRRLGRTFGPDPANPDATTVGGMIGRNASGSRFARHGAVRGRIAAAEAVLADGAIEEFVPVPADVVAVGNPAPGRLAGLAMGLSGIVAAHRATIARMQPATRASHGGYRLDDVVRDGMVDLPRALCGSEGTLAIVTEATVRTVPADADAAVGLLLFDSLDRAAEAAVRLQSLGPSACDLFDRRHLALARGTKPAFDLLIPPVAEAGLLVEFVDAAATSSRKRLDAAMRLMQQGRHGCVDMRRAEDAGDAAFFWELSRNVVSTLHGVRAAVRPVPFIEDIVVPPRELPAFLRRLQEVLKQHQFTAMIFGHAAQGQVHVRPYADPRDPAQRERLVALADAVCREAADLGGTIGGEQGLGLSRTGVFARHFPEMAAICGEVKRLFDPIGLLNPGRVVPAGDATAPVRASLREGLAGGSGSGVAPLPVLVPSAAQLGVEVDACNGCGSCRSQQGSGRMCPRFRENPAEEASPRAKANLLAAVLSGTLDPRALAGDAVRSIADTCFNCHQCRSECSAGVDIPAIVMATKAAHHAANSLPLTRWMASRVDRLSALGGATWPLSNWAPANPQARWVLEQTVGIARGRKLPEFSGNQLIRWAARRGLTRPSRRSGPRVLYFLDTYARRHDPLLAQAFVAVLERNGIGVFIDPRQVASGMPLVSEGDLEGARRLARTNVRILAEAVRLGYRIVATEPSAVTCIRHDYPLLVEDDDMERVVAATCDATTFLWELHRAGTLRLDFRSLAARILYH